MTSNPANSRFLACWLLAAYCAVAWTAFAWHRELDQEAGLDWMLWSEHYLGRDPNIPKPPGPRSGPDCRELDPAIRFELNPDRLGNAAVAFGFEIAPPHEPQSRVLRLSVGSPPIALQLDADEPHRPPVRASVPAGFTSSGAWTEDYRMFPGTSPHATLLEWDGAYLTLYRPQGRWQCFTPPPWKLDRLWLESPGSSFLLRRGWVHARRWDGRENFVWQDRMDNPARWEPDVWIAAGILALCLLMRRAGRAPVTFWLLAAAAPSISARWAPWFLALGALALLLAARNRLVGKPATERSDWADPVAALWFLLGLFSLIAALSAPYLHPPRMERIALMGGLGSAALLALVLKHRGGAGERRALGACLAAALPFLSGNWLAAGALSPCIALLVLLLHKDWLAPLTPLLAGSVMLIATGTEAWTKAWYSPATFLGDGSFYELAFDPEALPMPQGALPFHLYRGRKPVMPKWQLYRIVVMGGSVAYGWRLPEDSDADYPARLAGELGSRPGQAIEVVNAAVPSFTSVQGLRLLRERILILAPDLLILSFGTNDNASEAPGPGTDTLFVQHEERVAANPLLRNVRWLMRHSGLYLLLQSEIRRKSPAFARPAAPRVTRAEFVDALVTFIATAKEKDIRLAFTGDLYVDDPEDFSDWGPPALKVVREVAAKHKVPLLDPTWAFREAAQPPSALFFDTIHLTPLGHEVMARGLARELRRHGLVP